MVKRQYNVNKSYSKFRQQKLNAWQPILTAGTVLPTFFLIGLLFIPIGVLLLIASNSVTEFIVDYTDCAMGEIICKEHIADFSQPSREECRCRLNFELKTDFAKPVFVYYGLTGFYQNHRRYVNSRDDVQLLGDPTHSSSDCAPYQMVNNVPIAPCGAIANSIFNDTFLLKYNTKFEMFAVPVTFQGIAWPSDLKHKFKNPPVRPLSKAFNGTVQPPNWPKPVYQLSDDPDASGFQNESLIVWMRSAALPNFRKLHSRVLHLDGGQFADSLPKGNYTVEIGYNFPTAAFEGRKRFIISNASWAGGKNSFLGVAYIVVGSFCIIMAFVFMIIHFKFGRSLIELASIHTP